MSSKVIWRQGHVRAEWNKDHPTWRVYSNKDFPEEYSRHLSEALAIRSAKRKAKAQGVPDYSWQAGSTQTYVPGQVHYGEGEFRD